MKMTTQILPDKKNKKLASYIRRVLLTHWSFRHVQNKKGEHFFYDRKKRLGEGAFARVYKAYKVETTKNGTRVKYSYNKKNSRPLVAKVSEETFSKYAQKQNDSTTREPSEEYAMWAKEANLQAKYIPTHATQHTKKGRYIIISDFLPGDNIEELLSKRKNGGFSLQQGVKLTTQILALVNHIHHSGIVHTDIKLENMLLQMQGQCHAQDQINIIDYGLATTIDNTHGLSYLCNEPNDAQAGTPEYFAPEALMNVTSYARDIYALTPILLYLFRAPAPLQYKDAAAKKALTEGREHDMLRDSTQATYNFSGLFRGHLVPKTLAFIKPLIKILLNGMQAGSPGDRPDADLLLRFFSKLEFLVDRTEALAKGKNKLEQSKDALKAQKKSLSAMKKKGLAWLSFLAFFDEASRDKGLKKMIPKIRRFKQTYKKQLAQYKKNKKQYNKNAGQYQADQAAYKKDLTQIVHNYRATRLLHPKRTLNEHYKTYLTPHFKDGYKQPSDTKTQITVLSKLIPLYKNNKTDIAYEKNELGRFIQKLSNPKKPSLILYGHLLDSLKENTTSPTDTPLKKFLLLLRKSGYKASTDLTQITSETVKPILALYKANKEKILHDSKHDLPTLRGWAYSMFCALSKKPNANEAYKRTLATIAIDGASTFKELIKLYDYQTPLIQLLRLYLAPSNVSLKNKFLAIIHCAAKNTLANACPKDIVKCAIRLLLKGTNIKTEDRATLCKIVIESKHTSFEMLYRLYDKKKITHKFKTAYIKKLDEKKPKADATSSAKNKFIPDKKAHRSIRRWAREALCSAIAKDDQNELARIATEGAPSKELARAYKKSTSPILKKHIAQKFNNNPTYAALFTRANNKNMRWYTKLYHRVRDAIKSIPNPTYKAVKRIAQQEASVAQPSTPPNPQPVAPPTSSSSTSEITHGLGNVHTATESVDAVDTETNSSNNQDLKHSFFPKLHEKCSPGKNQNETATFNG